MDLLQYKPKAQFAQRHLLTLQDYTPDEILQVLSLAAKLKLQRKLGMDQTHILRGKNVALIFTKPSMRTRVSFEVGVQQLGGHALYISGPEIGLGTRESVYDVANVLSRFVDGIMIRTFHQSDVEGLAKYGQIPVINGLTDDYHPCQVLADLLTLYEHKGALAGKKLAFVGDGNNMANSLMIICSKLGVDVAIATPAAYAPQETYVSWAKENAKAAGSTVTITTDIAEALRGADAVYTDVWASMGMEAETEKRARDFVDYQVNSAVLKLAKPDAIFLHCLPAHRGSEVTDEVMDGPQSVVFDEAENRLHAQKAVLALLMAADEPFSVFEANCQCFTNRPLIGIITKIDSPYANVPMVRNWMVNSGCERIFEVSNLTREGIQELLDYLQEDPVRLTLEQAKARQRLGLTEWEDASRFGLA